MDALLDTLLSRLALASVQAVPLAAIVYAACRFVPSLSAAARSTLWWLLGAQLAVGLACPAPFALPWLPAPVAAPAAMTMRDVVIHTAPTIDRTTAVAWMPSWIALVVAAWALAVLVQAGIAVARGARLHGVVRRAMPHDDVRVETLCARRARELGLRRSPRLAVSTEVDSPQVVGFLRPTILLPLDDRLADDERDMALMHELAHVRRGDLVLGWIPVIARTLFFFHPLAHLAAREYALCREAACDALVVARGRQAPRSYGRLLLRLGVAPRPHHALAGASPTFRTLKRRLDMLGHATDAPPRVITACLVVAIAAIGVTPWRVVDADSDAVAPVAFVSPPPPAPPAPAAPAAPVAPTPVATVSTPAPPPPPAAPAMPGPDLMPDRAFIYFGDDVHVMNGSRADFRRADAVRDGAARFVWYRDGAQAWTIRDPAYLKRIESAFARAVVPADKGAIDAEKIAGLDRQQAVLNEQMAKLAERQAELAVRETRPGEATDRAAYAAGHAALGKEQAALAQKMAELAQVRAMHGRTQAEWGREQAMASRKAAEEVNAILAEAIRNHAAQSVH